MGAAKHLQKEQVLLLEGHSLHWTKLVEIIEESNLIFGGNIHLVFKGNTNKSLKKKKWEIVSIAHQLFFTAVAAIEVLWKYERDCTDSIFYIL